LEGRKLSLKAETFVYTGAENLEAMAEAKNYNDYLISMIEKALKNPAGKKILDFGAGAGTYADILFERGIIPHCLEPDKALQNKLRNKGYKIVNDIKALKPNSYDLIYALNVFEHIEDDMDVFKELTKALKKDGIIIVYVPAFQSLFSSMDRLVGHHRRYRKKHLKDMAEHGKMNVIKLHYCDPVGFTASLLFKATGNKSGVISANSVKLYDRVAFPISRLLEPILKHALGKNAVLISRK
jgi:SAM-dependent methyltransferase